MLDQTPILQLTGFPFGRGEAIEIPVPKLYMVDRIVQQNRHVARPSGIPWLNQFDALVLLAIRAGCQPADDDGSVAIGMEPPDWQKVIRGGAIPVS